MLSASWLITTSKALRHGIRRRPVRPTRRCTRRWLRSVETAATKTSPHYGRCSFLRNARPTFEEKNFTFQCGRRHDVTAGMSVRDCVADSVVSWLIVGLILSDHLLSDAWNNSNSFNTQKGKFGNFQIVWYDDMSDVWPYSLAVFTWN